jgi:hypothetical protein
MAGHVLRGNDQPASRGAGPLLQRDYWAVISNCGTAPKDLMRLVRKEFGRLAPESLVEFTRSANAKELLQEDEVLEVKIRMGPTVRVRVADVCENSFTIVTQDGHPEAGRITFGFYRNDRGDVIFHIRSRARSKSRLHYAGFLVAGDPMQTNTWVDLIDRLSHTVGDGVVGSINAHKCEVREEHDDAIGEHPTFIARSE